MEREMWQMYQVWFPEELVNSLVDTVTREDWVLTTDTVDGVSIDITVTAWVTIDGLIFMGVLVSSDQQGRCFGAKSTAHSFYVENGTFKDAYTGKTILERERDIERDE